MRRWEAVPTWDCVKVWQYEGRLVAENFRPLVSYGEWGACIDDLEDRLAAAETQIRVQQRMLDSYQEDLRTQNNGGRQHAAAIEDWVKSMAVHKAYNHYCFHFFDGEEVYDDSKRPEFKEEWMVDQIVALIEHGTPLPDGKEKG